MRKEHKMEKLELVEVTQKKVNCQYRNTDGTFGPSDIMPSIVNMLK